MKRPCFLVVDREFAGSISTRKLLIETAKMNVITAYSGTEALELFERFPAVSGVVLDSSLGDVLAEAVIKALKQRDPNLPVVVIEADQGTCAGADFWVRSFDPARLLDVLRAIEPEQTRAIDERDKALNEEAIRR
jgi:DNA-binding NtrC family response regulator